MTENSGTTELSPLDHRHAHDHDHEHEHDHDHGHDHDHDHGLAHSHAPKTLKALLAVIALTTVIFLAEVVFGLLSGSLALLADAAHMLSDSAGLVVALVALLIGRKKASPSATYGYRRIEVLSAAVNALVVGCIGVWIVYEAFDRVHAETHIDSNMMLIVAIIGLIANTGSAIILVRRQHDSLNMKGAYLHVLSDMFGSAAVIIAGFIVKFTGFVFADTVASIVIAVIILPRTIKLFLAAMRVLMERVPEGVDTEAIRKALDEVDGVAAVHDLHVWSTDGTDLLVTCHVVLGTSFDDLTRCGVLDQCDEVLRSAGATHCTVQIESAAHSGHEDKVHD